MHLGFTTNSYVACSPSSPSSPSSATTSSATMTVTPATTGNTSPRPTSRKGGIIFPSVKNKPIIGNNTFASEIVANYKDVKVSFKLHKNIINLTDKYLCEDNKITKKTSEFLRSVFNLK